MYEYKMIQAEKGVLVKAGRSQGAAAVHLQTLVDTHAVEGWEYYSMETISTLEEPGCGCLGRLLGFRAVLTESYVMVFRRAL